MKPWYLRWWGIAAIVFIGSLFLDIILVTLFPLNRILLIILTVLEIMLWVAVGLYLVRLSRKYEKDAKIKEEQLKALRENKNEHK